MLCPRPANAAQSQGKRKENAGRTTGWILVGPHDIDGSRLYGPAEDPWYMAFCAIVAYTRYRVRRHRQIKHGDVLTDMCIAVLFYPLALVQHEKELRAPDDFYDGSLAKESEEKEA